MRQQNNIAVSPLSYVRHFLAFGALLLLLGCGMSSHSPGVHKMTEAELKSLIDKDHFIANSTRRSKQDAKYGPVVSGKNDRELRANYRRQIAKDVPPDYASFQEDSALMKLKLSMNVENINVRTMMAMLSEVSGVNVLVSDEVQGQVTAQLKDVPWPNALESVLQMKKLAKHVDRKANIIRIHDQDTVVKLEEFERTRLENLQRSIALEQASEPLYTEIFKLFYAKPGTVKGMLDNVLDASAANNASGLRNTNPDITVDERQNMLVVKARKEDMTTISRLIDELDTRTQQVFIEAFIVEVTDGFENAMGVRLGLDGNNSFRGADDKTFNTRVTGLAGVASSSVTAGDDGASLVNLPIARPFGGIGFLAGIGTAADLKVELTAMEAIGLTKVISNPRIFTLDNQEATIFQGDEVPYETVSQDGTKIEFKEAGLKLAVTPNVVGDGNLLMDIIVNKDTVDTTQPNPPITKSEIKTSLVSKNGEIVVIGGIYVESKADSSDKVPGLGDIPGAGKLFRSDSKSDDRRELMIFIAPRIL
ncbi:MAG: type IV pilus secretin PilQ [Hyphomicrobiales bacterium]|nr:type IV pilus secretin PilQ [Rickettsiales bacterium]MCP5362311.1 type IV pilus secretin PilQ [Hyphomicrobiales bacterium]